MVEEATDVHIHMIGICGIGMGSLAGLLQAAGHQVTGSDENVYPPMSTQLAELGIVLVRGYDAAHLVPRPDLVIIGNAVRETNPEVRAVLDLHMDYMSFPGALAEFFIRDHDSIVITGTHGKTTSTALLAWVLEQAGLSPSLMVGGIARNFEKSFRVGQGRYIVLEGDEYRTAFFHPVPKFHHYRAKLAVINSMEFDHADIFRDIAHIQETFRTHLIGRIPADGFMAVCTDYAAVRALLDSIRCDFEGYGLEPGACWHAVDIDVTEQGTYFTVTRDGEPYGSFFLALAGRHNVQNALGVVAICHRLGLSSHELQRGFKTFLGVKRRQEIRAVADGVIVMDDFAHHPTKVRETVRAIKASYPRRTLWAVFEPRTQSSRRDFFQRDYAGSFDAADHVVVSDVFMAEQIEAQRLFDPARLVRDLVADGRSACHLPDADAIVEMLRHEVHHGDVVLIMTSGGFDGIHDKLVAALRGREAQRTRYRAA